jgi:hypothetical protein
LPLIEEQVDPTVWTDGYTVGWARTAAPALIHFKDLSWFPHQKQYPLKPEVNEGLIPIIKDLQRQGLLIECSSPYNTPILGVRRGPNKWRLVQDLCLINEAVVPLHPVVPNPYMLLAQRLLGTTYYSVLDLKDAFAFPYTLKVNLSLLSKTPQESLDRSPGLSSSRDLETAPISLHWL